MGRGSRTSQAASSRLRTAIDQLRQPPAAPVAVGPDELRRFADHLLDRYRPPRSDSNNLLFDDDGRPRQPPPTMAEVEAELAALRRRGF